MVIEPGVPALGCRCTKDLVAMCAMADLEEGGGGWRGSAHPSLFNENLILLM